MNCNQCGRILDYVGGDCYMCHVHGYDWMKERVQVTKHKDCEFYELCPNGIDYCHDEYCDWFYKIKKVNKNV